MRGLIAALGAVVFIALVPVAQADVQPYAAFLGHEVPVVSPADLHATAFTEAHLRGSRPVGWRSASAIAVEVRRELQAGQRFVYAYYGGIDKTAHERGFGEFYDAEPEATETPQVQF